ncbi:unnamed protein product [Scytosiphon promiscuus]
MISLDNVVRVRWAGFDENEDTWEPLQRLYKDAPQFVRNDLRKMGLVQDVRLKLKNGYGIVIQV